MDTVSVRRCTKDLSLAFYQGRRWGRRWGGLTLIKSEALSFKFLGVGKASHCGSGKRSHEKAF